MTPHKGVELRLLNTGSRVQSNHSPLEKLEVAWSKSYLTLACGTITGDKKKKSYKLLSPSNKSHKWLHDGTRPRQVANWVTKSCPPFFTSQSIFAGSSKKSRLIWVWLYITKSDHEGLNMKCWIAKHILYLSITPWTGSSTVKNLSLNMSCSLLLMNTETRPTYRACWRPRDVFTGVQAIITEPEMWQQRSV